MEGASAGSETIGSENGMGMGRIRNAGASAGSETIGSENRMGYGTDA